MIGPEINVEQSVGKVGNGATIYGIYINNLESLRKGDLPFNPPDEQSIAAYLRACVEPSEPEGCLTEAQKALREEPVQATIGEFGGGPLNIYDAVDNIFKNAAVSRVVILAKQGVGRTPGLEKLQSERAKRTIKNLKKPENKRVLPFYINLSYLLGGSDLFDLMLKRFNLLTVDRNNGEDKPADHAPIVHKEQMISLMFCGNYQCLFLLDDAEVLLSSQQPGAVQDVNLFMEDMNHQYVIACRTSSYNQQFGATARLYLTELPIEIAEKLITDTEQFQYLKKNVPDQLRNRYSLNQLLGQEAKLVLQKAVGQLVKEDIYSRLGLEGDKDHIRSWLAERFLEDLAIDMYFSHTTSYQESQVINVINHYIEDWKINMSSRTVLEYLKKNDMLRFDNETRTWSFCHHSAQAYFAAAAIAANPNRLEDVMPEISDYWWREVLVILTGLLPDPSRFVFDLIDRDELVAANCAEAASGLVDPEVIEAVIDGLVERMHSEGTLRRKYIVERLGNSPHPKALQALLLAVHQQWSSKVLLAIVLAISQYCLMNPDIDIAKEERELLTGSHRGYQPVSDILELCIKLDASQRNRWKKQWVCQLRKFIDPEETPEETPLRRGLAAIGLGLANDKESRQLLLNLFEDDKSDFMISWCAVEALSLQADAEDVKTAIEDPLSNTSKEAARRRSQAIFLLGHMKHDQTIIEYLEESLEDENPFVRAAAVEALAEKDLPEGRARKSIERLLHIETDSDGTQLCKESDPVVLRRTAESLGRIGTTNTIPLLVAHKTNLNTRTRRAMKKAIEDIRERQA